MHLQSTPQRWIREGDVEPTGEALDAEDLDTSEALVAQEDPVTGSAPGGGFSEREGHGYLCSKDTNLALRLDALAVKPCSSQAALRDLTLRSVGIGF